MITSYFGYFMLMYDQKFKFTENFKIFRERQYFSETISNVNYENSSRHLMQPTANNSKQLFQAIEEKIINVLFYTRFWNDKYWNRLNENEFQHPTEMENCPVQNCKFTTEKQSLPSVEMFDALIFHHAHGWSVDGAAGTYWKTPEVRNLDQYYIFAADEFVKCFKKVPRLNIFIFQTPNKNSRK